MCGIVGLFNLDQTPVHQRLLKKMTDEIAHRGPDGEGQYVQGNIGLGHRRLAILDTSERGAQPMHSHDGQWSVVFNGCIYNFQAIRRELEDLGHAFRSTTDTEVITEGLAEWGPSVFERFDGMFAIGAWHHRERTLYLSRDRFGIKPLYYWFNGKTLVFSSEIKAILRHPDYRVGVDLNALNEYFTFQNAFTYRTLFRGVIMLPPANTVQMTEQSREVLHRSWWNYDFSSPDESMSFEDAVNETQRLMRAAVKRQMIADVPVGSYLSGGMDSGSITAIASEHVPRLSTFTGGFDMSEVTGVEANYDERRDAELMANFYKTEHYEQVMNAGDLSWSLPRVVWHIEDLRMGMSYPNYYISRLASKFVKVCLQGTGGDELFGGYPWRYYRICRSVDRREYFQEYYDYWQRLVADTDKPELFQLDILAKMDFNEPRRIFERVFLFNKKLKYDSPEQHIQNSLYFEIKTFLPGLLLIGDKLSMANGLEERFPFMDNDLVDFAQKIPIRHKLAELESVKRVDENEFRKKSRGYIEYSGGKNVLRQAMMKFIPPRIIERKKQGFSAPDESWYRGENARYIEELLQNRMTVSTEFIRRDYVDRVVREHMEGRRNNRLLLWSMLNFEWWCRIFLQGENPHQPVTRQG